MAILSLLGIMQTGLIIAGIIIMLLLTGIAGCYLWISGHAIRYVFSDARNIPFRKTALVLGTAKLTPKGGVNLYFKYRMDAAVLLFTAKKSDMFIVSGANRVFREDVGEADEMKADLVERGLPPDIIVVDRAGYRTWDSLWRCRGSFGQHTVTVISQKFHVERAIFTGHRQGLDVIGFCAEDVKGKVGARMFLRECLARVKCILDCYFIHPKPVYMRRMH